MSGGSPGGRQSKCKLQFLKKSSDGRVSGGKDLHKSATFTSQFCDALFSAAGLVACRCPLAHPLIGGWGGVGRVGGWRFLMLSGQRLPPKFLE